MTFTAVKNYALFYATTIVYSLLALAYEIVVAHVPPDPAIGGYFCTYFLRTISGSILLGIRGSPDLLIEPSA
jgi:hypothetical protein